MKLYYMDLTSTTANIYTCEHHDRHKIWVEHPNAKEITKKQYEAIKELTDTLKNKTIK